MTGIRIGSNILSLQAQRRLSDATGEVSRSSERLSSGLRINRASDDAAGLAISSKLGSAVRVYSQAIRNANDGLSVLSIAQGGAEELTGILTRLRELAQVSANGTYSAVQRISTAKEADELTKEFNRILETTSFNGLKLLDRSLIDSMLQLGYGTDQALRLRVGAGLSRTVGTGSFGAETYLSTVSNAAEAKAEDIDGDGDNDLITVDGGAGRWSVRFNDGSGNFGTATDYLIGATVVDIEVKDFNGDGRPDIVGAGQSDGNVYVRLNTGGGTFGAQSSISTGLSSLRGVASGDFDGDGDLDLAVAGGISNSWGILSGNGSGGFTVNFTQSLAAQNDSIEVGDFNGDGRLDVLNIGINGVSVQQGNGRGGFSLASATALSGTSRRAAIGDINRDGTLDLVVGNSSSSSVSVLLGNGDGTFRAGSAISSLASSPHRVALADLDGDGVLDLGIQDAGGMQAFYRGNGEGGFSLLSSTTVGSSTIGSLTLADLNNDGVLDSISTSSGAITGSYVRLGAGMQTTSMSFVDLRTREGALAAIDTIDAALARTSAEIANIGALQSRLGVALGNLATARENFSAAEGRIQDVDVASESAALVRQQILQRTGAAILAQANQAPALALQLLGST